ncbi:TonB-dependent receptor plug domain-containing protein [Aequorivita marina]|uniref:TonB-dependent receptor plug domain-containing protein n=1 Tax=Aequorivita marina TaxID=3073654 RepID=UPI0028762F62|nr:TonB-dependent receptor plug domain-containing protein [Aequorivita sp. S2608]MDS1298188.1 TonB-dependent receptor [Aequorivita sp. S2608]
MKSTTPVFPLREIQMGCLVCTLLCGMFMSQSYAQENPSDSLKLINLSEVVVITAGKTLNHQKQRKPLSTLDEFLESSRSINMVKRGAYAWEPTMNDMASERLAVTIDGMQIFGACTDKMDPITSYVDVSNLSEAEIGSGQQGAVFGNTIGGGINLKLDKSNFKPSGWSGSLETAFETNNKMRVFGGELNYSDEKFYLNTDAIYRKADNYKAGGNTEVNFSQFEKYNFAVNSGYKLAEDKSISATLIYDEARDVGYPALTMDVSLARAVIGSVSFNQDTLFGSLSNWETKVYYNTIKHVMDDTTRPDVIVHMDMPGWSDTAGFYTQANLSKDKHDFFFKADGFYNKSYAEMTMYPTNSNEPLMFMLTWPDVRTKDVGFYAEDHISFKKSSLKLSTRLAYHSNSVEDEFGLNSLKIFYPEMTKANTRFLKSFSAHYHSKLNDFHFKGGVSYGERAPSVSEGYGFYLFNSYDNHDYIGDPDLNTESSADATISVTYKKPIFEITAAANYFYVVDYIIGKVDNSLSTMTIGADGVKIYTNLAHAELFNTSISGRYSISNAFKLTADLSYHRGIDDKGDNLPLISPISYNAALDFYKNQYSASLSVAGAGAQTNYNPAYGETKTAAYAILSASFGKRFFINENDLFVKAGIQNIFDANYSSYTDWNNIPRMGRNIYATISYSIN